MNSTADLRNQFDHLYNQMAASDNVENMALFGSVAKKMMYNLIENKPEEAKEYIDTLCAMNWHNYLTEREATAIVNKMDPSPVWSKNQLMSAAEKFGIETSEEPYYNDNALWVTASMEYSDHGRRIAEMLGMTLEQAQSNEKFIRAVLGFATDKLKDKDGVFNIREYFDV